LLKRSIPSLTDKFKVQTWLSILKWSGLSWEWRSCEWQCERKEGGRCQISCPQTTVSINMSWTVWQKLTQSEKLWSENKHLD
jgi:hypothetical protein